MSECLERYDEAAETVEELASTATAEGDASVAAALHAAGWCATTSVEAAVEWFRHDYEYAAPPADTSLRHNIAEEFTRADFGDAELLVRDPRGFDAIAQ